MILVNILCHFFQFAGLTVPINLMIGSNTFIMSPTESLILIQVALEICCMVLIDDSDCLIGYPLLFCHLMGHLIASLPASLTVPLKHCQLLRYCPKMALHLLEIL